jgi:hypothetical protein
MAKSKAAKPRARTRQNPTHEAPHHKPGWQDLFLEEFAHRGNVLQACEAAGVHRSTAYEAKQKDTHFATRWEEARADAVDRLVAVARERAVEGWQEPVFYLGRECGGVQKYDHGLLWKLIAAHAPETYGQKVQNTHTGRDGGAIDVRHTVDLADLSDEELDVLERIAARRAAQSGGDPG